MRSITLVAFLALTLPTLATARTWHVPGDAPTIQAGIDLASPGDTVLVAEGVYGEHNIIMRTGVWLHSEVGPVATVVDASGAGPVFVCADLEETAVIQGFTIRNGTSDLDGGGVRCIRSRLVLRDCIVATCTTNYGRGGGIFAEESRLEVESCEITGCYAYGGGGGIGASPSEVTISGCQIRDNVGGRGGGIAVFGSSVTIVECVVDHNLAEYGSTGGIAASSPNLTIRGCLVTNNLQLDIGGPSGLHVIESVGLISNCTVTDNRKWFDGDPAIGLQESTIDIEATIIAFNEGAALSCNYGIESNVTIHCSDSYGNTEGDDLCGTDLGGNFSADPLFCDAANNDYTLDGCSPCLPGNHPDGVDCGLIGALGQGCGATPVEETSWGRIKALYMR